MDPAQDQNQEKQPNLPTSTPTPTPTNTTPAETSSPIQPTVVTSTSSPSLPHENLPENSPPVVATVIEDMLPTNNIIPPLSTATVTVSSPPNSSKKFQLLFISLLFIVITAGTGLSFLYFRLSSSTNKTTGLRTATITPIVSSASLSSPSPTQTVYLNPFVTPTVSFQNPFASPTASLQNPFRTYENPFADATASAQKGDQPYQNPFNK